MIGAVVALAGATAAVAATEGAGAAGTAPRPLSADDIDRPIPRKRFRVGLTFEDTAAEVWEESRRHYDATGQYLPVSRGTVLGRMHEHKEAAYREYIDAWNKRDAERQRRAAGAERARAEGLPF